LKIALRILVAVSLVFFGAGCASSGKAVLLAQKDPIALVSVVSNEDVNWKGEKPTDPNIIGVFTKRKLGQDPDLAVITSSTEIIDKAESMFREAMAASKHINLAEKDTVFRSRSYQDAAERKYPNRDMVKSENYRFVNYRDKNFPAALAAETGIQRTMFVEFNFTKFVYLGASLMGTMKPNVEMIVTIQDARGKTIYRKTVSSASSTAIKVVNEVYSQSELLELFWDALAETNFKFLEPFDK